MGAKHREQVIGDQFHIFIPSAPVILTTPHRTVSPVHVTIYINQVWCPN